MELLQEKILQYMEKINKKISTERLKKKLDISGEKETLIFETALTALVECGKLYVDENGEYQIFDMRKINRVQGEIYISKKGNGYVTMVDPVNGEFEYLIHPERLNGALSGDIVVLNNLKHMKSKYILAEVEKIVKRNHSKLVFEYQGDGVFVPYNQKTKLTFYVSPKECEQYVVGDRILAKVGAKCLGKILDTPVFDGEIIRLIGHKDDPNIDIETIAYDYGFCTEFSEKVHNELNEIPINVSEEEIEGRIDLRNEMIFTIDGDDTKDIDDAISVKTDGEFYYVGVHIADVTHYVKPGMALYEEAQARGTSAYLLDYVLPMLPHRLSNGICSLNPNVDRLTLSVEIKLDKNCKIIDYDIFSSVINSRKQMTYNAVNSILEEGIVPEGYEKFTNSLKLMNEVAKKLEQTRKKRGSIDFASNDVKIKTDDYGKPISIEVRTQKTGEKIIENFMLLANETVATHLTNIVFPTVYRIHEGPNVDKFKDVLEFIKSQNLVDAKKIDRLLERINNSGLQSWDVNMLLDELRDKPYFSVISHMILKTMSKAIYSPNNEGHYGLSLENYTHFTSPIRRFPDLTVHRIFKRTFTYDNLEQLEAELPEICEHSSFMERQAEAAEKAANELKMAEYMMDHIGEHFEATVISCNRYGMVVRLDNFIKGKVDYEDILDGFYCYGEQSYQLINVDDHSKNYKIGDRIFVKVKEVSIAHRNINFYASKEDKFKMSWDKAKRLYKKPRRTNNTEN